MADRILQIVRAQKKITEREIKLIKSGKKGTIELRRGRLVDTTKETLAELMKRLDALDGITTRHIARTSKS